ncbi:hypothetical protein [Actinacidiphila yeochonensis]|uniref:hypothetical protein n=1 Tax=Actinacidiphila yeochonensis TaxID=89050 RepID=UPI00068AF56D|nr:hypothetical protein [Actinacidiphila yeochonensis]
MRSKPPFRTRFASRSAVLRRERVPLAAGAVLAAAAVLALAACTAGGSSDGADSEGTTAPVGSGTVSAAPGKYKTLPQPCTAVDLDSLRQLVPGAVDYSGRESLTYDTDRLVGCSWSAKTAEGTSRKLTLNIVRVVSYDPGVSDEVEAETDFEKQAGAASIPSAAPSSGPSSSSSSSSDSSEAGASDTPSDGASGTPSGTPSGTSSDGTAAAGSEGGGSTAAASGTNSANGANGDEEAADSLSPRRLSGVGNAAFINDVASTRSSASTRTVTVVFRAANVLATIGYTESTSGHTAPPSSADLQKDAQKVATELQRKVEG